MCPYGPAGDNDAVQASQSPKTAIDWQQVGEEILCPLCYYNLRGLIEPRCPECGYRFEWSNLLAPENRRHPYLFEHHPNRKPWSFYRTLLGGLRPREFWSTLKPSQPSRPALLALYWVMAHLLLLLGVVALLVAAGVEVAQYAQSQRSQIAQRWAVDPVLARSFPTRQALDQFLDQVAPLPPSWAFFKSLVERLPNTQLAGFGLAGIACLAALSLFWPWLTFLTLMIFRISMRRARVRTIHVLRCVVYCSDACVWVMLVATLALIAALAADMTGLAERFAAEGGFLSVWGAAVLLYAGTFMYRITIAYSRYLKFDHCFLTILAAQVIAFLLVPAVVALFYISGEL